jgi:hypothetical protein
MARPQTTTVMLSTSGVRPATSAAYFGLHPADACSRTYPATRSTELLKIRVAVGHVRGHHGCAVVTKTSRAEQQNHYHITSKKAASRGTTTAEGYLLSVSAYPGCESAYGTEGAPYKSHDSYAAPSVEDGYATWQG